MLKWTDEALQIHITEPKTKAPYGNGVLVYMDRRDGQLIRRPSHSHDMSLQDFDLIKTQMLPIGIWEPSNQTWWRGQ